MVIPGSEVQPVVLSGRTIRQVLFWVNRFRCLSKPKNLKRHLFTLADWRVVRPLYRMHRVAGEVKAGHGPRNEAI